MRRLFEGGAYSSKYGTHSTVNSGYLYQYKNGGKVIFPVPITERGLERRSLGGGGVDGRGK